MTEVQQNFDLLAQRFPLASRDLANNSVTSAKIVPGTIVPSDVATGTFLELAVTGTARKVAYGNNTVTWTAAVGSATRTVTHGLGTTPQAIYLTIRGGFGSAAVIAVYDFNIGATTFDVAGSASAVVSITATFDWMAIG